MKIYIEPNDRGGWSLRWEGDDVAMGNYATPQDAKRIADHNFADVEIVVPPAKPVGIPAMPALSPAARIAEISATAPSNLASRIQTS